MHVPLISHSSEAEPFGSQLHSVSQNFLSYFALIFYTNSLTINITFAIWESKVCRATFRTSSSSKTFFARAKSIILTFERSRTTWITIAICKAKLWMTEIPTYVNCGYDLLWSARSADHTYVLANRPLVSSIEYSSFHEKAYIRSWEGKILL